MSTDPQTETARALLWRHGLPEDVIDGALCLHAQELAAVQRRDAAVWGVDTAAGKHILAAADLIDPTRNAAPAAGGVVSAAPDQADDEAVDTCRPVDIGGETIRVHGAAEMSDESRAALAEVIAAAKRKFEAEHPPTEPTDPERRERYAEALYATLEVSPTRHPWATLSPFRRAVWYARADAAMAVADEELRRVADEAQQQPDEALRAKVDEATATLRRVRTVIKHWEQQTLPRSQARLLLTEVRDALAGPRPDPEADTEPTEEQIVRDHVTTVHLIGEQLAGIESWMWGHLADVREADTPVVSGPRAADDKQDGAREVVHGCPPDGSGLTPCCGRTPFELPLGDRISSEAPITCRGDDRG